MSLNTTRNFHQEYNKLLKVWLRTLCFLVLLFMKQTLR